MKLTIPTKLLSTALASLKGIAKPNTTHAILSNVILTATGKELKLLGLDLEKQLTITLACEVKEPGETTISCAKLHDWLSSRSETSCDLSVDAKHKTTVRCGKASANFTGLPVDEFPPLLTVAGGIAIKMPAALFSGHVTKALSHASIDKQKAQFMAVLFSGHDGKFEVSGSNGNRVIICSTDVDFSDDKQYIAPRDSAASMAALATVGDLEVTLAHGAMSVQTDNCQFVTRLIESSLPKFHNVVTPKEKRTNPITVNRIELLRELESATAICGEIKCVDMVSDGSELTIRASESQEDKHSSSSVISASGGSVKLQMPPHFLRDALKCCSSDEITLGCGDEATPVAIEDGDIISVISPLRFSVPSKK